MNSTQTEKPTTFGLVECINMTDQGSEGRYRTLPYRYFSDWIDIKHKDTDAASGWPSFLQKTIKIGLPQRVNISAEGTRVNEPPNSNTLDMEVIVLESGLVNSAGTASIWPSLVLPYQQSSETSTKKEMENSTNILPSMLRLFSFAREMEFEDGVDNPFGRELMRVLRQQGQPVVDVLADVIPSGKANIGVGAEALRWVGRMHDPLTYESRRWLLERCLFSRFPRIRDGAVLGLSSMNDPHSILYLRFAIDREEIDELRADLEQVLRDLEEK